MPQAEIQKKIGPHKGNVTVLRTSLEGAATCVWSYQSGIACLEVTVSRLPTPVVFRCFPGCFFVDFFGADKDN